MSSDCDKDESDVKLEPRPQSSITTESVTPPKKKLKYSTTFNNQWLDNAELSEWLVKFDIHTGECKFCKKHIYIKYEGKRALLSHANSKKHKDVMNCKRTSQSVSNFFRNKESKEEDKITAIEVTSVYHGVKHHHSYASQDCLNKLYGVIFTDSNYAKKIACGRTKCTSICESILAPAAQEILLEELKEAVYFSVGTDSSNKGNLKMFPVTVQYFSCKEGLKQGLLDFYEDPQETSIAIKTQLCRVLEENNLSLQNVSSLSADNASVNFGIHNSVYQKLLLENNKILKANCKCHILHNTTKFALKGIRFDVESLVLKVYSEFSAYAKRTAKLKEFFQFVDIEYRDILKHVPTRWLSLLPAIDRLLSNWPALREYFLEEGENECSQIIWQAFEEENSFALCCTYFLHNTMQIFDQCVKLLESNYITCTELHSIMIGVRQKIVNRKEDNFYGQLANSTINKVKHEDKQTFIQDA